MNDLLARYAAGTLSAPLHVLVASHLAMRSCNRGFVNCLESLNGKALEDSKPALLRDRQRMLDDIFATPDVRPVRHAGTAILPSPLHNFLNKDLADIRWRWQLPGLRAYSVVEAHGCEANLYLIKAGHKIPSHTHEGSEITLVLKGAFSDQTGRYGRGDIAIADAELDHHPVASADEDCLCYAVIDAPLHLTGPFGRVIDRLIRH